MKNKLYKWKILFSVFLWFWLIISWFYINWIAKSDSNISYSHADYIADFTDKRRASWFANNIFVAQVVEDKGIYGDYEKWKFPLRTRYSVKVLYNIKWEVNEQIDIVRLWWMNSKWEKSLMHWSQYIDIWDIFIFTWWEISGQSDLFWINSHENWSIEIFQKNEIDKKLSSVNLTEDKIIKELIESSQEVIDYRDAYKNEVYSYKPDLGQEIYFGSGKNEFDKLSEEEKELFESFDNWFISALR